MTLLEELRNVGMEKNANPLLYGLMMAASMALPYILPQPGAPSSQDRMMALMQGRAALAEQQQAYRDSLKQWNVGPGGVFYNALANFNPTPIPGLSGQQIASNPVTNVRQVSGQGVGVNRSGVQRNTRQHQA